MLTCAGLGSLAGGGLALRVRPAHPLQASCLLVTAFGLPALVLGLGLPLPAVAVAAAAGWAGLTASNALWQTALQQHVPLEVQSRVSAYGSAGSFAAIPLGLALAGPAASAAGAMTVLIGAGATQIAAGLAPLAVPAVRHLGRAEQDGPATR